MVDATAISAPGRGPRFRLHSVYEVGEQRFSRFELSDRRGAEALERAGIGPGELAMGDRVYARPGGLRQVIEAGGEYLVRLGRRSLALAFADGRRFDLAEVLDLSERNGGCDLDVLVLDARHPDRKPLPARVVVLNMPAEAAERARKRALRESLAQRVPGRQ